MMRAPRSLAAAPLCRPLLGALAVLAVYASTAVAQRTPEVRDGPPRERRLALDSTRVTVSISARGATLTVGTPAGSFRVGTDSATLAGWADAASRLRTPWPGGDGALQYDGIVLRQSSRHDAVRLTRVTADGAPIYQLDLANGAWDYGLRLSAPVAESLFAVLRGKPDGRDRDAKSQRADALFEFQVETPVVVRPGAPTPRYPGELQAARAEGDVVLQFVVGADGAPRQSTFLAIESTHPAFTRAVAEAVMATRYEPARIDGAAVAQYVQQRFEFRVR